MDIQRIILFTHPSFMASQSMPRFAGMLADYFKSYYPIQTWTATPLFYRLGFNAASRKWFGYFDSFLLFPLYVGWKSLVQPKGTLYVFADQALGPWVPLVKNKPHVIHCHDFLALRSALGEIPQNPTGTTGKWYQSFIRNGFSKGKNFISVSQRTQEELHRFHKGKYRRSYVVYNGLNRVLQTLDTATARNQVNTVLQEHFPTTFNSLPGIDLGYWLHVGGNQWYKNRIGVVQLYTAWRKQHSGRLPLLLVGQTPPTKLLDAIQASGYSSDIILLDKVSDASINALYSGATALLFPSLAEGFGWPIAEAMAAGTPVITTDDAPMNEVGGDAAGYIAKSIIMDPLSPAFEDAAASILQKVADLTQQERNSWIEKGRVQVTRFQSTPALEAIHAVYKEVVGEYIKFKV